MESYTGDVKQRYYGKIEEIWELSYAGENVPMFRVRWAKNVIKEDRHFTTMVIPEAKSKTAGAKVTPKYEPTVLASQVDQCLFITDPQKPSRVVVRRGKRSIIGMDGAANELDFDQCAIAKVSGDLAKNPPAVPTTSSIPHSSRSSGAPSPTPAAAPPPSDASPSLRHHNPRLRRHHTPLPFRGHPPPVLPPFLVCRQGRPASDLESKVTEAFVDDDFELAAELYDDRDQAHIKLDIPVAAIEFYLDTRNTIENHVTGFTEPTSDKLLPDLLPEYNGVITLVLDLNETLVYTDWQGSTELPIIAEISNMANNEEAGGSGSKPFWMLTDEMEVMESQPRRDDGEDDGTDPEYRADDAAEDDTTDGAAEDDTTDGAAEDDTGAPKKLRRERRPNVLSTVKRAFTEVNASGHPTAPTI
ncbi:hypothetical protein QYE76_032327 [Lolium multiflorum]|uniref:Uncharacterized protein n=1 Tax=Lolium multiflorum TaxID=4521 RepID=A0AAD8QWL9_LOLMU|nr:hypothetical protein QYE76_032327 [Lolium multiflorum]